MREWVKTIPGTRWAHRSKSGSVAYKHRIKYKYGITVEEIETLKRKQNGCCALCSREKLLTIDHCHKTGVIRGLLCRNCNSALGKLGDTVAGLQKALNYVLKAEDNTP